MNSGTIGVGDVQSLLIEHACSRLQYQYCQFADRRMVDEFVGLFTSDATIEVPGMSPFSGHAAIRASIQALGSLPLVYRHITTNSLIEVIDDTRARGSCYLVVFNSEANVEGAGPCPSGIPSTVGEYHDSFQRTAQGWRIRSRRLVRVFRNPADPMLNHAPKQG